jgi:hypothetical protein
VQLTPPCLSDSGNSDTIGFVTHAANDAWPRRRDADVVRTGVTGNRLDRDDW